MYGPVPVEVALFADGGVAWNRGESPSFLGGSRQGAASVVWAAELDDDGPTGGFFRDGRPLPW